MGMRFDPWSGKTTHDTGLLSPGTTTPEPMHPRVCDLQREAWASQLESGLCSLQLERARMQQQTQHTQNKQMKP